MFSSWTRLGCAFLSFVDNVVYGCYRISSEVLEVGALVWAEERLEDELWKLVGHPFTNTKDAKKGYLYFM